MPITPSRWIQRDSIHKIQINDFTIRIYPTGQNFTKYAIGIYFNTKDQMGIEITGHNAYGYTLEHAKIRALSLLNDIINENKHECHRSIKNFSYSTSIEFQPDVIRLSDLFVINQAETKKNCFTHNLYFKQLDSTQRQLINTRPIDTQAVTPPKEQIHTAKTLLTYLEEAREQLITTLANSITR